jgi:hypothetical protein
MLQKGLIIFGALSLYSLLIMLLDFPSDRGAVWSPAFATALFTLLVTNFFAPCLVHKNVSAANLVLELLAELDGWAWVSAFEEEIIKHGGNPEERMMTALSFIGFLLLFIPFYFSLNTLLRDHLLVSPILKSKLATFDGSVVGYVMGFALQVLVGALTNHLENDDSVESVRFSLELFSVTVIVYFLERLRARASNLVEQAAAVLNLGIEVAERAFSVFLGFAWLHTFKPLYNIIIYRPHGDNLDGDDASWLMVSTEMGYDERSEDPSSEALTEEVENSHYNNDTNSGDTAFEGDTGLSRNQATLGIVWLIIIFVSVVSLHAVLEVDTKQRKLKENREDGRAERMISNSNLEQTRKKKRQDLRYFKRTEKRIMLAYVSLAFGFAIQKTLGDLTMKGFGWDATGEQWATSLVALGALLCFAIRKARAHKKRTERQSQVETRPRRATTWAGGDGAQRNTVFYSDTESSDDDDTIERHLYKDDEPSFEVINEMWRGSMLELPPYGSQSLAESTAATSQQPDQNHVQTEVQNNAIPLGPFADSGETEWHYDLFCSCSPHMCMQYKCCSNSNCCNCGVPCIQTFFAPCGCCNNILLGHLSTKLEAAGVKLCIGFYGIIYVYVGLFVLQQILSYRLFGIVLPIGVAPLFAIFVTIYLRGKMRRNIKLRGSAVNDCLSSFCCNGCVVMQMVGQAWKSPPGCTLNDMDGCVE